MILLTHLLFGAAIGSVIKNVPLAIILAFLSHYFLDILPHIEYPIKNIEGKQWRKAMPDILRVILDFSLGILLIAIFSKNQIIIYICAVLAIFPDGLTVVNHIMPIKVLEPFQKFHQKIHFLKYKKISSFWRIFSQATVIIISITLLKI